MSNAKRTNPRVAIIMAKVISPTYVLVERFCPKELHTLYGKKHQDFEDERGRILCYLHGILLALKYKIGEFSHL